MPAQPRAGATYIIYLYGRIVEEKGTRPTDERFGVYEYQKILDTLASSGAEVIAERRPQGTDFRQFGLRVADQVRELLAAGVPPERIAVVGFALHETLHHHFQRTGEKVSRFLRRHV